MSETVRTLGFGVVALAATLALYASAGLAPALVTMAVLMRGWSQRVELPGQGGATVLLALALTSFGLGDRTQQLVVDAVAGGSSFADLRPLGLLGTGLLLGGIVGSMVACSRVAAARGRSRGWALAGLFTVLGFGVLVFLPPLPPAAAAPGPAARG